MPHKDQKVRAEYMKKYRTPYMRNYRKLYFSDPIRREMEQIRSRRFNKKLRMEALFHYSGKVPKCDCCGETTLVFLGIDHVDKKLKKQTGSGGKLYQWLKHNNYPSGFRVLCHNCNMAIGFLGYCPHELSDVEIRRNVDFINDKQLTIKQEV